MNYIKGSLFIGVIVIASFVGLSAYAKYEEAPRISAAEAYKIFKTGDAVFVDANPLDAYDRKHILGSVNIPNDGAKDIEALRNMELPFTKDKKLIIYCL
jgi:rhodanese-related sulfurtransferase